MIGLLLGKTEIENSSEKPKSKVMKSLVDSLENKEQM
jgi:hypothetical protein